MRSPAGVWKLASRTAAYGKCGLFPPGRWAEAYLSLAGLDSITILASYDFNLLGLYYFVGLHLELCVLDNEGPNVVTETICAQVTLLRATLVSIAQEEMEIE